MNRIITELTEVIQNN